VIIVPLQVSFKIELQFDGASVSVYVTWNCFRFLMKFHFLGVIMELALVCRMILKY